MPQACINTESGEIHIVVDPTSSRVIEGSHHDWEFNLKHTVKAPEMDCLLNDEKNKLGSKSEYFMF